ncbi:MAG: DNA-binding response OmpR family regulator, partial [Arcobacteraceae bacterium]
GEDSNLDNIRALIKRIRKKLPLDSIKIVTGYGYTLGNNCKYS